MLPPLFAAFAAAFFFATRARFDDVGASEGSWLGRGRGLLPVLGLAAGAGAGGGFISLFGWEIGLAWCLLWLGLATVAASIWLSLRPRSAPWLAAVCTLAALGGWILSG